MGRSRRFRSSEECPFPRCTPASLHEAQQRHPQLLAAVRGAGLMYALEFRQVARPSLLRQEPAAVPGLSTALGVQMLGRDGVYANLSAHGARLTPPLTIPEPLFDELWERVERAAAENHGSWQLLLHSRPHTLYGLARVAAAAPAQRPAPPPPSTETRTQ